MWTVHEASELSGVSIRTLQYYDNIGLLPPTQYTPAGYRLYDDTAMERLQQILLFKELQFPLQEIQKILDAPDFDRDKALTQQIELLTMKKERLQNLIDFARTIQQTGVNTMAFDVFDTKKLDEYADRAKAQWGHTAAYKEYEQRGEQPTPEVQKEFMLLFAQFGAMKETDPAGEAAQEQVKKLQDFITAHYYTCTKEILNGLGAMYACGGEFTENIDKAGGDGTAAFTAKAIEMYCKN